ncbi:MAG: CFI-box-CTERM domain-containing protein [Dehalococcoidia bacterium]
MNRHIRVMAATLLIVTALLVFLPSGYVGAGGMVTNPGFELGEEEVPYGWDLRGDAERVDTGLIYGGEWAAQVTGDGDMLTQWIENITPMVTYEAWVWMYVSGDVKGVVYLDFWEGKEGRQLVPTTVMSVDDTAGGYVQQTSSMYAPVGATHVRIRLLGTGWGDGGEARFDEVGFYPVRMFCFVATAAYGTETAAQLGVLRDFRDHVLLNSPLGARFVATYYKVSPPVADFIAQNEFLRVIVREALIDPAVNLLQRTQDLWEARADTP